MATAGLVIRVLAEQRKAALIQLDEIPQIVDIQAVPNDINCLAVVFECEADLLKQELEKIKDLPFILTLDIASINYEDDIEVYGEIPPMQPDFSIR